MSNLRSIFCILIAFSVCKLHGENSTEIRENFANVAQSSKDLAYSVGSLLHSVGNEFVNQTKKLGGAIADYVESLQQAGADGSMQVQIQEHEKDVTVVINGLENIDLATCRDAKSEIWETYPVQVHIRIQINPDTILILSSDGYEDLFINLVATSKQVVEENKDATTLKASSSKQQKITKQMTTAHPIDLKKLTIDLDTTAGQMLITIPYSVQTVRSVPVNIK